MLFLKNILYTSYLFVLAPKLTSHIIGGVAANHQACTKIPVTASLSTTSAVHTDENSSPVEMTSNDFNYKSGTSSVAFVTTPDDKIAKKLAHGLVERKLAACVNIIPNIQSVYMWEGKVNEDNEYLMIIKTQTSHIEELTKWVRDNHPYSVAEVITLPIEQGNLPYMKWLAESVPEKK
ncbi:protein CutA homolog [Musca vetustissima]|uniref:protein CutA homolog n=1 Tax=Musca vetustissima TaxID=27455 RepID=UPI002AB71BF9|nr:protein CutA homolog [Musca vetustissima]